MAEGRRGLGRGLSALLGEADAAEAAAPADEIAGARETPIELIRANPDQPRKSFSRDDIDALAASIREKGILQPILTRPMPGAEGEFQIVAGERRWRAAQVAGLRTVPILVRQFDDRQVLEIAIVENVQRTDLNPYEEALGYKALIEKFGHTQEAVAEAVGKSRPHVANALRLLNLPQPVLTMLVEGELTAGHARALVGSDKAVELARRIVAEGMSVRQAEALLKDGGDPKPKGPSKSPSQAVKDHDTTALESDLADILGLEVEIRDAGGKGEVRLKYATLEQLDDLCRRLTRAG
ncbi:ParB/RepB/Spo0J family partition protein [Caulobacter sp. NIBR1757]|uniref:ParB/RepB/Spo0J family partition protein n=1 Tax=Caulobacter sp. NIBR1757 TaxID=3016000 RepID=UPI0022F03A2C|nr:ParB/RepB/Spo0J family partition protein [Caulobacter sp. NIBR1757]WGM37166.1 Chromosome-partitioning protein ParB [Caulobacter sp. NIBR1757]